MPLVIQRLQRRKRCFYFHKHEYPVIWYDTSYYMFLYSTPRKTLRAFPRSYVQLAIRLGQDARYRQWAGDLIGDRSSVLWERRHVVVEWARFLSRAAGRPAPTASEVHCRYRTSRALWYEPVEIRQCLAKTRGVDGGTLGYTAQNAENGHTHSPASPNE